MVFEENFLRLTVTICFPKNEYCKNVNFLIFFFSQEFIMTWFSQNKFTFHAYF